MEHNYSTSIILFKSSFSLYHVTYLYSSTHCRTHSLTNVCLATSSQSSQILNPLEREFESSISSIQRFTSWSSTEIGFDTSRSTRYNAITTTAYPRRRSERKFQQSFREINDPSFVVPGTILEFAALSLPPSFPRPVFNLFSRAYSLFES